jgi:hypothetical protein
MMVVTGPVRQCRPGSGPLVFVLMALPAPLLGLGMGALARAWGRSARRSAGWLALLVLVLLILPPLIRGALLQQAPHSLLTGVWGLVSVFGFRAEEALLRVPTLLHRFGALILAALLLSSAEAVLRRRARQRASAREKRALLLTALLFALLVLGGDRTGFGTGRGVLDRHLHGALEEEGLVLRFDPAHLEPLAARRLLDDALWHRQDLTARLGLERPGPVTLWAFSARSLRKGAVGLSYGNLAAPWRGEAVIQATRAGRSPTLRHELVHLMAAAWTSSPLGVPLDPARTEGLATALERRLDSGEPFQRPHAAALAAGKLPAASTFVGARRFWLGGQSVRNAYDLAGSFVGFLLERFGADPVRAWYAGADPDLAFGLDLEGLDEAWRARLAEIETEGREQESAGRRLEEGARSAVHRTRCGRLRPCDEVSLRREAYRAALGNRRWEEVLGFLEDPVVFPPGAPGSVFERAWVLELAHRGLETPAKALGPMAELLEALPPGDASRPLVFEMLLRLELAAGREAEMLARLEAARGGEDSLGADLGWLPVALESPDREEALSVFLENGRLERALALLDRHPEWPELALWTWRRILWPGKRVDEALALGAELRAAGENIPAGSLSLLYEDQARGREDAGDLEGALESWRAAEELREDPLPRARAREEGRRLAWRMERAGLRPPRPDRGDR